MRKWLFVGISGLFVAYMAGAPYVTIYRMRTAVSENDSEALSKHIDFPSVRQSLKGQLNAMIREQLRRDSDPLAAFGLHIAIGIMDNTVESSVTPSGLLKLMAGEYPSEPKEEAISESSSAHRKNANSGNILTNISTQYKSMSEFEVATNDPGVEPVKFVLRRNGLAWKMTEIILSKTH